MYFVNNEEDKSIYYLDSNATRGLHLWETQVTEQHREEEITESTTTKPPTQLTHNRGL